MKRTLVGNVSSCLGERVKICGWVEKLRKQKHMQFLNIRDHTGKIQVIHEKSMDSRLTKLIDGLSIESSIEVIGIVVSNPAVKLGGIEVVAQSVNVANMAETPIPVDNKSTIEVRLDWRFLDLRTSQNLLIFKLQTLIEIAMRSFWGSNGFIEIHSPKFMGSASESGAELFEVKYFDRKAYLAQSPQFYKQMAMAAGFDRVFEIGPVFRANPSFTSRHDTEFTMYDVEMSFISSHHDLMNEEEKMIVVMLEAVKEKYGNEIRELYNREIIIPIIPFPRLTLREVKEILSQLGVPNERGNDMSPEEERAISEYILKEKHSEFVFIHEFPASVRAFYSMRKEDDPKITKSFDLLWNGLEITSGAQREHRFEQLKKQIQEQGLNLTSFKTYLNFFRYGCPPHGGFAPGPTRMLMKLLNISNVRDVTYLYRGVKRLEP